MAVVGAGPAGLSAAIRLKQLRPELTVCILEKGSTIGAHSLSGAVMEPGPLDALLPEWRNAPLPIRVPVTRDEFRLLGRKGSRRLPWLPQSLHNTGNFIISLGGLNQWLATQAEQLGVDVFAGFAAALPLFGDDGSVSGVQIGDMGVQHDGSRGPNYTPGPEVHARLTIIAEGCRGSLAKQLIKRYKLDAACDPQVYALGMKELWQLPKGRVQPGLVQHSFGWPLDSRTYGGSFVYHLNDDRAYVGFVTGLDYIDPRFSPFEAFQQFKHHPEMHAFLQGGEILSAGARSISAGGWQSMPKLEMPGAVLIGDAAGTLNVPKIKGIHQSIRCGVAAAEYFAATDTSIGFDAEWRKSAAVAELREVRNVKPGFKRGLWLGLLNAGIESVLGGTHPLDAAQHRELSTREARRLRVAEPALEESRPATARPALVGVLRGHRARRSAAGAPARARPEHLRHHLRHGIRQPLHALLPRARSTRWSTTTPAARSCTSTRPTACTARPATSRTRTRSSTG